MSVLAWTATLAAIALTPLKVGRLAAMASGCFQPASFM